MSIEKFKLLEHARYRNRVRIRQKKAIKQTAMILILKAKLLKACNNNEKLKPVAVCRMCCRQLSSSCSPERILIEFTPNHLKLVFF